MSQKTPRVIASSARGSVVRLSPLISDPGEWFETEFDWDDHVAVVDMFSGAGGLSFGLDSVPGMAVVGAFERNPWAIETHRANIPGAVLAGDVQEVDSFAPVLKEQGIRRVDLLAGGPPCQGFSRLGKGALRRLALEDGRGVDRSDPRNWLFREFMRAVIELTPKVVLIENVPEMANQDFVMEEIRRIFADLDYWMDYRVLSAEEYGVPQRRRRLFIVAGRIPQEAFSWPTPSSRRYTVRDAIADLPEIPDGHLVEEVRRPSPERSSSYVQEMRKGLRGHAALVVWDHVTRAHRDDDRIAFSIMKPGDRYTDLPAELRRYRDDIFTDKYHRMLWDEPAWTVTAHLAKDGYKYIHPGQSRTISVREAARLQSFPDRFRFAGARTHRFAQIGNAVPPKLAEALGRQLRAALQAS